MKNVSVPGSEKATLEFESCATNNIQGSQSTCILTRGRSARSKIALKLELRCESTLTVSGQSAVLNEVYQRRPRMTTIPNYNYRKHPAEILLEDIRESRLSSLLYHRLLASKRLSSLVISFYLLQCCSYVASLVHLSRECCTASLVCPPPLLPNRY